jgi:hypothetical protein
MKNILQFIFLFALPFNLFASTEYLNVCFKNEATAGKALIKTKFVLIPPDKAIQDGLCIDYLIDQNRVKLLNKYLLAHFNDKFSMTREASKQCRLELLKVTKYNGKVKNRKLGRRLDISNTNSKGEQVSKQLLLTQSGESLTTEFDQQKVELLCQVHSTHYDIFLKSLSPRLKIQTSFLLRKGERKELGSFSDSIKNEKNKLGIKSGINLNKKNRKSNTSYYLLAK